MNAELTWAEEHFVERFASVMDYCSQVALGVSNRDPFYLRDKAGELARTAEMLEETLDELAGEGSAPGFPSGIDVVMSEAIERSKHYRAAQGLFFAELHAR